jgi:hypothetical protein
MSEKYPLWRRLSEEIFSQLIRDQPGPYAGSRPQLCGAKELKVPVIHVAV